MYMALVWKRKALLRTNCEFPYYLRGINKTLNTKAAGNHGVVQIHRALLLTCRSFSGCTGLFCGRTGLFC